MELNEDRYARVPGRDVIDATVAAMKARGFDVVTAENGHEALEKLKGIVPKGASVMTGSSTTLNEIGFSALLAEGVWNDLHKQVLEEQDQAKRADIRKEAAIKADFFIASVNALSKNGELVSCDASGSRVSASQTAT